MATTVHRISYCCGTMNHWGDHSRDRVSFRDNSRVRGTPSTRDETDIGLF